MKIPDQHETQSRLAALRLTCSHLSAAITRAGGEPIQAPQLTTDILSDVATFSAHAEGLQNHLSQLAMVAKGRTPEDFQALVRERDTLRSENAALRVERDQLKAKAENIDAEVARKVAATVVELGFSDNVAPAHCGKQGLSTTQRILKAKGLPLDTKVEIMNQPPKDSASDE